VEEGIVIPVWCDLDNKYPASGWPMAKPFQFLNGAIHICLLLWSAFPCLSFQFLYGAI